MVFGITVLLSAVATINPVWLFGPYNPSQITAGSQPDWYIGFLDGMLRIMPPLETTAFGHTISWNILFPALILPGIVFTLLGLYPFIEAWVTGDKREHHLLDRPRNQATRTGIGVMAITFYVLLWVAGANDIIATHFDVSINAMIWFCRIGVFVLPPIAYVITKRICLGLQRRDRERLLHGRETGVIRRLPSGEFIEVHAPISDEERVTLLQSGSKKEEVLVLPPPVDSNGVRSPGTLINGTRARLSRWYFSETIPDPTPEELHEAAHHAQELAEDQARQLESGHS